MPDRRPDASDLPACKLSRYPRKRLQRRSLLHFAARSATPSLNRKFLLRAATCATAAVAGQAAVVLASSALRLGPAITFAALAAAILTAVSPLALHSV